MGSWVCKNCFRIILKLFQKMLMYWMYSVAIRLMKSGWLGFWMFYGEEDRKLVKKSIQVKRDCDGIEEMSSQSRNRASKGCKHHLIPSPSRLDRVYPYAIATCSNCKTAVFPHHTILICRRWRKNDGSNCKKPLWCNYCGETQTQTTKNRKWR